MTTPTCWKCGKEARARPKADGGGFNCCGVTFWPEDGDSGQASHKDPLYAISIVEDGVIVPYTYEPGVGVRALTPEEHAEWATSKPPETIRIRDIINAIPAPNPLDPNRFTVVFRSRIKTEAKP